MLGNSPSDVTEVRQILADIVDDDMRASDIIKRLRAMMTKTAVEHVMLDVNALIREVAT